VHVIRSTDVHRSQSRVSAHVAALERELGVTLIDRSRRAARLTMPARRDPGRFAWWLSRTLFRAVAPLVGLSHLLCGV
jgi:regulatory helix-turn-helix LysR family protein